ncbi:MAG: hypothetical protein KC733_12280, partial [Candidatus Omnitrophica bacterium]|nr:hypothetical protein [Candidatus Omnitrophota bacterium]
MIRYFLLFAIFLVFTSLSLKGEATPHGGYTRNPFIPQLPKKKEEPPPVIIQEEIELPVIEKKIENEVKKIIEDIKPKEIPITPPTFTISGIIWNSDRPQAII